ncbi:hypothetical protein C0Z18_07180 [Trinickia dabaoshanensis]|uniref:Uncharacterized protein n=1 Tax=Trinickia dabaoshanensis TaxID=564714 RepID=A0A2N7VWV0_9BURK|nr:hypothetical protein [Trinickia dabaoshanensis]PMS21632.1 hypothetical protein C0Z18_07180 [Trinickia dabaoshanensis]
MTRQRAQVIQGVEQSGCISYEGRFPGHCPLCLGPLVLVPDMPGHARHAHARQAAQCVLTTDHYQPLDLAGRVQRNVRLATANRRRFAEDWERHYALIKHLCPTFSMARMTTTLSYAEVLGIWSYAKLREEAIAPLLLALAGFMRLSVPADLRDPPHKSIRWLRFWFDASVRDIGDLWAARSDTPGFFRIEYSEPEATPFPTGRHVIRWTMLHDMASMWGNLGNGHGAHVTPAERNVFERFFKQSRDI